MIGRRIELDVNEFNYGMKPGDYGKAFDRWYVMTPNGLCGNVTGHSVIEHEDGTITVSPSILVNNGDGGVSYHGYLEKGVWREV